jgi:hypothetical protein
LELVTSFSLGRRYNIYQYKISSIIFAFVNYSLAKQRAVFFMICEVVYSRSVAGMWLDIAVHMV